MSATQTDLEDPAYLGRTKQPPTETLIVNNKDLAPLMARAASVVPRNSALPVLGHVLLQSSADRLTVLANNLEMAIRQSCVARGPERSVCVEATTINALLQRLTSDAEIRMEFADQRLVVKSGAVRATLATIPVEDFPAFRDLAYAAAAEVSAAELQLALSRTRPFVVGNESRYYLSGVHFRSVGNTIRLEGTDGKCLGLSVIEGATLPSMIVPLRAVDEILKLIGTAPVQIRGSAVAIEVQTNGVLFVSKLIDAAYPDVDRVIPALATGSGKCVWCINRDAMLRVIATASAMGSGSSIADFHLSETGSRIRVEERDDKLKRDDEVTIDLDDAACSFSGDDCAFRIRLSELTAIVKAAGAVSEFRPNDDMTWFRIADISDPRATFVVGTYR